MNELTIIIDDVPAAMVYGTNNQYLKMLCALYPKLRIVARGDVVRAYGDEHQLTAFEEVIQKMRRHILHRGTINEDEIITISSGGTLDHSSDDAVVYTTQGKAVKARTANQQALINAFGEADLIMAIGPAGTGKTYLSIALAVKALKEKNIKKIILCRPAVEAGEKLGFLPGDMKEKIDPYLQPLYDALEDMMPPAKLQELMEKRVVQIAPLAFMRGRTLSDAVVILDEAQNTTSAQLRMFLTRMGLNTKMILTGDLSQIDLPPRTRSGLSEAVPLLQDVKGVKVVAMNERDIQRNKLVERIVKAYKQMETGAKTPES